MHGQFRKKNVLPCYEQEVSDTVEMHNPALFSALTEPALSLLMNDLKCLFIRRIQIRGIAKE